MVKTDVRAAVGATPRVATEARWRVQAKGRVGTAWWASIRASGTMLHGTLTHARVAAIAAVSALLTWLAAGNVSMSMQVGDDTTGPSVTLEPVLAQTQTRGPGLPPAVAANLTGAVDRQGREVDQEASPGRKGAVVTAVGQQAPHPTWSASSSTDRAPVRPLPGSPAGVPSLVFIKCFKVGGSTMAGVVRRIAAKFDMSGVRAKRKWIGSEPGVWAYHGEYFRFRKRLAALSGPKFVLALMRNPLDRCLSHYYHLKSDGAPNDDGIIKQLRSCKNFEANYLGLLDDTSVEQIMARYDFLGTTERYAESVLLLTHALPMNVSLGDVLYLKAKDSTKTGMQDGKGRKITGSLPYSQQSQRVRDVVEKEFKPNNERDYALWTAINARLDRLGDTLGRDKLAKELESYKAMLAEAESKCGGFAINQTDCFFNDIGCGISCLDSIGGGEVAQKVRGKRGGREGTEKRGRRAGGRVRGKERFY